LFRSFLVDSTAVVVDGLDFATLTDAALLLLEDKKRQLATAILRDNIMSRYLMKT
jgi:hypothetical protein